MIERLTQSHTLDETVANFCEALKTFRASFEQDKQECGFSGDIETSFSSRLSQANDNSVYQVVPQAIIFPKTTQDVLLITKLANEDPFQSLRFTPKGGGTGTNGQALTKYIVVDMSRYMRDILDINVKEGWVRVQSGVIKDQLNDYLRPFGYFFAPDLSTSNRATIGGMINTDASGQGSLVYGKTSDHIIELEAVTISGERIVAGELNMREAQSIAEQQSGTATLIYQQAISTCTEFREEIKQKFPRLNRYLTGYDLKHAVDEDLEHFNLAKILAGSEGTLAFITSAKLNITKIPTFKTMVNICYDSFDSALRNSPFLVQANATSVETVDSKVLGLAKDDVIWSEVKGLIKDTGRVEIEGLNIVEFNDEDETNQQNKVEDLCTALDNLIQADEAGVISYTVTSDLGDMAKIYAMRKKSVGLLGNTKGKRKPIAFVEDTAVPPEHLADFIGEFRRLLDSHELEYGMFGHVDAGVLHVRPALDLSDPEQEQLLRTISDEVVKLTAKYNGLMWGEHGKGFRSEYGPEFFGEELFLELRKIKSAFDPNNRLNPGKICTPLNSNEQLVSVDDPKRAAFDKLIPIDVKQTYESAINCNGNGLCFNYDASSPMCPSYKVSRDRRYSPKGRATLMREWLRLQGEAVNKTNTAINRAAAVKWFSLPSKLVNSIKKAFGEYDFSHEVKDSMDACLACKACTTACPIKVDVPTFRSRFMEAYYFRYLRPISDHLVANVEKLMPKLARAHKVVNLLSHNPISKFFIERVIGYVDSPKLTKPAYKILGKSHYYSESRYQKLEDGDKAKVVFVLQDTFTSNYESSLVVDAVRALKFLGYNPMILPQLPNGKPQHVKGFLKKFSDTAKSTSQYLNNIAKLNKPIIGLDASMVLTYRDEYRQVIKDSDLQFNVQLLSEWLVNEAISDEWKQRIKSPQATAKQFKVLTHCTEKSLIADSPQHWTRIFDSLGLNAKSQATGCCGMAGTFGHEKQNQEASKGLYDLSWRQHIEDDDNPVLATGFSCRCQSKRFSNKAIRHPIQIIAELGNN